MITFILVSVNPVYLMKAKEAKERTETLIQVALSSGRISWSQLLERTGVSRRTLASALKRMIKEGRVQRTVDSSKYPPAVLYAVTASVRKGVYLFRKEFESAKEDLKSREILARIHAASFLKAVEENIKIEEVDRLHQEAVDSINYIIAATYADARKLKSEVLKKEIIRRAEEAEARLSEMVAEAFIERPELISKQFLLYIDSKPISMELLEWALKKGHMTEQDVAYAKENFLIK